MRHLTLTILAVSLLFLGTTTFATENWEKERIAKGWSKVDNQLLGYTDTTWYAKEYVTSYGRKTSAVMYISSDGKKITFYNETGGFLDTGKRWNSNNGSVCIKYPLFNKGEQFCLTLWKKDGQYQFYGEDGKTTGNIWKIKKGNLEKL